MTSRVYEGCKLFIVRGPSEGGRPSFVALRSGRDMGRRSNVPAEEGLIHFTISRTIRRDEAVRRFGECLSGVKCGCEVDPALGC